jgi:uncharacterized SAM-binding protein YcdF (DUF218 family)
MSSSPRGEGAADLAPPSPARPVSRPRIAHAVARLYRSGRALLALGMLLQLILAFTPVADGIHRWLDVTREPQPADVIVCLGGSDQRVIWAADLYRRGYAPLVVVSNKEGAAHQMKNLLVNFGVPAENVLVEAQSSNTFDHPSKIATLPGIDRAAQRFLIVTDRAHSRRAAACFRTGGYPHFTTYAGRSTASGAPPDASISWRQRVMNLPYAGYECAALLKYRLLGRI